MFVRKDPFDVIKMLRKQIADLEDEKQSVKRYIEDSYNYKIDELKATLQNWLENTTNFIQTAHSLIEDVGKLGRKKWPLGLDLNPKSPSQLRKKAEQICKDIAAHVQKARGFSNIPLFYRQEKVAAHRFEDFESRSSVLDDIMEAIQSPFIHKIGVYGEPGAGKTMLVKEVKRRAEQGRLFDVVVMATVGRNPDFQRIQDKIARVSNEQTGLIEKKVLVILDDVWQSKSYLELVGINGKEEDNVVSYKILLTSRDRAVVSPLSETQIEIGKLAWQDAWNLFKKIADDPDKSRGLPFYANEITKKCEELPIAVATLANALRGRNLIEWKTTLRKLQSLPSNQANSSQIPQSLHSAIELHYNGLKSDQQLQQTFLLCSLLDQNATIQNLLKYGIGLGLFPGVKSMEEARAQVLNLVTKLRDSSLLLDGDNISYFDVHDLVRDFATSTTSKEHGVLALKDNTPINWSDTEAMESIKWIYLSNEDGSPFPDELKCPKLTLFHLSKKGHSLSSPPNLFRDKEGLKVLSLSKLNFSSIASSIYLPKNLCTLCMDEVEFGETYIGTMMGELENLQVLSLAGSDIKELPKQMGQLVKLKLLDLSDCTQLRVIPPGVLSCLSRLEELYMRNSFNKWAEGIEEHQNQNTSLEELKHLELLTTIEVNCDIQWIPEGFLFSENLATFKIFMGDRWIYWNSSCGSSKFLKLKLDGRISSLHSVKKLLKKTNELHLEGLIGAENVVNELDEEGFQELKYLLVKDALKIQHIISVEHGFPILEVLVLCNLENMKKICHGQLGTTSFSKLSMITIECCNMLKNLFSSSIAKQLQQLREIRVIHCNDIEVIVDDKEKGSGDDTERSGRHEIVELNSLLSLRLQHLSKLISFNSSCKPMTLFNEKVVFPSLEELQLSSIMVNNIIRHNSMASCVEKLTKLIICGCDNLEYLFSSSTARVLLKLKHLQVKECKSMKMIIITENEKEENLIFSQLNFLLIEDLHNLVGFYSGNHIVEFSSLKQLHVLNCLKLERFVNESPGTYPKVLFNEKVVFPSLEELQLSPIMVNNIIRHNSMASCVEKLTKLIICGCDNLEYLFSSSTARVLLKLKHLQVKECKSMKMIIITENEKEENLIFSQLNFLLIKDLHNLVGFYSGNHIVEFSSLKQLHVLNCLILEQFVDESLGTYPKVLFNEKVVFPSLEELQLSPVMVNNIIRHNSMASCVEKLTKLIICGCDNLEYLFSSSTARVLLKLKHLQVKECKSMKMIIITENEKEENLIFSQLNFLLIEDLHNLVGFYSGNHIVEFSSLKQLHVLNCLKLERFVDESPGTYPKVLFNEKVVLTSNLEELQLCSINVINSIWHPSMKSSCVGKLKKLIIHDCGNLECLFSFGDLEVRNSREANQLLLPKLKRLELGDLPNLNSICDSKAAMACDSLEQIIIWNCWRLKRIPLYLTLLDNGKPSAPPSLKKIIVWPQKRWESLKWDHLNAEDVLQPFYGSYHSFPFELVEGRLIRMVFTDIDGENIRLPPSILGLVIEECNNLRSLNDISGIKDAKELKCCRISYCRSLECVLSSSINPLVQKIEVLHLRYLQKFEALFEAEAITNSPLPPNTFSSLKTVRVWWCPQIKKLFPFRMHLQSLEEIEIAFCEEMEEIIVWDAEEEAGGEGEGLIQLILPKLKSLKLQELPALKSICSRRAVMVCDSLEQITIDRCEPLKRIPLYLPLLDNGQPSPPPSLKRINVWQQKCWESLEWDHPNAKDVLCKFRR